MAELIERELGLKAELIEGDLGEFKVFVDDRLVAQKGWLFLPSPKKVLEKIKAFKRP